MLMAAKDAYLLLVQPDDVMISPREVDETLGTMICFHPRYALGDHHNYIDPDDFLREMYLNTVGHDEKGMKRYEWMVNAIWSRKMTGPNRNEQAVAETMLNVISKKYIMLPLYLLDHSGLGISVDPEDEDGFKKAFFEIYEKNYTKAHREFAKTLMLKKYSRQKFADVMHNTVNELAG